MILLYIYLGTAVVTFFLDKFADKYINKEVKIRGYEYVKKTKNVYKSLLENIKYYMFCFVPVFNLWCAIDSFVINMDKTCEDSINNMIKEGTIVKKIDNEDSTKTRVKEVIEVDNDLVQTDKIIVYKVSQNQKEEMTRREKIEFLKQEYNRLTGEELQSKLDEFEQMAHKLLEKR